MSLFRLCKSTIVYTLYRHYIIYLKLILLFQNCRDDCVCTHMHADVPGKPGSMVDDVKSEAGRVEGGREMGGGETESVIFILFIAAEWPSPTSSSYLSSRRISTLRGREWHGHVTGHMT